MLTSAQESELKKAYQQARKAYEKRDVEQMIGANIEFRSTWLAAVQNSRLRSTIMRFVDHAQQIRLGTLTNPNTQKIVVDGMRSLLEAFVERDPKLIKVAMLEFMLNAEQQYFALLNGGDARD